MAILVVAATCGFVAWSKLKIQDLDAALNPIQVTTVIRKGGVTMLVLLCWGRP